MVSYELRFGRAVAELEEKLGSGAKRKGFWSKTHNLYLGLMKALRWRPIQYASLGGIWLRNAVFFFLLMQAANFVLANDWYVYDAVGALFYATIMTPIYISQSKRWGLSRWEDL